MAEKEYIYRSTRLQRKVVTSESAVESTTHFVAKGASPLYFAARMAVVAPAGMAVRRVATPFTVESTGRKEQAVKTSSGSKMRRSPQ